jgi:hypothetical protein
MCGGRPGRGVTMKVQTGQRIVVLRDMEVFCSVRMVQAGSVSRVVTVSAGEVLVVDRHDESTLFVRPHRYESLEPGFVEPALLQSPGYRGYYLELHRDDFTEHCKLLDQSV